MVAKLVLALAVLLVVSLGATYAAFRYFTLRAQQRHEKEMLREERDAELLTGTETDPIERELDRDAGAASGAGPETDAATEAESASDADENEE